MNTKLHQLATVTSYARVPSTAESSRDRGTKAVAGLNAWLNRRQWMDKLSEKDSLKLEARLAEFVDEVITEAYEEGVLPLRTGLIAEIHENLQLRLSPSRIARIEAGEDQATELILALPPVATRALCALSLSSV